MHILVLLIDHLSCGTHLPETFASICVPVSTFAHLAACFLNVLQHPLSWHLFLQLAATIIPWMRGAAHGTACTDDDGASCSKIADSVVEVWTMERTCFRILECLNPDPASRRCSGPTHWMEPVAAMPCVMFMSRAASQLVSKRGVRIGKPRVHSWWLKELSRN